MEQAGFMDHGACLVQTIGMHNGLGRRIRNIVSLLLRREFVVKPGLVRALVNICGLGQYELTLNGKKVGNDFLSPGWTEYDKTCLYDTRDITASLKRGKNAVGIELGNGMYNVSSGINRFTKFKRSFGPQKSIASIRLEYRDGSVETVGTDGNWRVAPGPITFSSIYGGEDFDASTGTARLGHNPEFQRFKMAASRRCKLYTPGLGNELTRTYLRRAGPIREFEIRPADCRTHTHQR